MLQLYGHHTLQIQQCSKTKHAYMDIEFEVFI
jgi:hypothetical protein